MKTQMVVLAAAMGFAALLAKASTGWDFGYKKFAGEYLVYSGLLGETMPPTPKDRKLSMMVAGDLAREMFDSMGPDIKDTCGAEDRGRIRRKQKVSCSYFPSDGYSCHIGINLRTGESIAGSIC